MLTRRSIRVLLVCLLCLVAVYTLSYIWFRRSHSFRSPSSAIPAVQISTSPTDSALLVLYYPAICLDDRFGPGCVFFRVDTEGNDIYHYRLYPFAYVWRSDEDHSDSPYP